MADDSFQSGSDGTVDLRPFHNLVVESGIGIDVDLRYKVVELFIQKGAETCNDLKYLKSEDLESLLPPLKIRRLIAFINADNISSMSETESSVVTDRPEEATGTVADQLIPSVSSGSEFIVPWHKFTREVQAAIRNGTRLAPSTRKEFIRGLADEVLFFLPKPRRHDLHAIAKKIVDKHQDTFADMDLHKAMVADGTGSLVLSLERRISNLARVQTKGGEPMPSRGKRSYGCVNWDSATTKSVEQMEEERLELLQLYESGGGSEASVANVMTKCFSSLRIVINEGKMPIFDIRSSWPLLFTYHGIGNHYAQLVGNTFEEFKSNFAKEQPRLMAFMQAQQRGSGHRKEIKKIIKEINLARQIKQNQQPEVLGLLQLLSAYFKESCAVILSLEEETDIPTNPSLVAYGKSVLLATRYGISVDGKVILRGLKTAEDALVAFFGCFYVFNLQYPKHGAILLEFIQRQFAGIAPSKGNKVEQRGANKSRIQSIHCKILSLMNAVNDFELL